MRKTKSATTITPTTLTDPAPVVTEIPAFEAKRVSAADPTTVKVHFIANASGSPAGKLADAELHFHGGLLDGLKLIGFNVWERRTTWSTTGGNRNITFPARQYSVNGERRSFALLRPTRDIEGQDRVRDFILNAWAAFEADQKAEG